jgi:hypothetical protein
MSPLVPEDDHRIVPGSLDEVGGRHDDYANAIGPADGAGQGDAEVKLHTGAQLADMGLIPGGYRDDRPLGIGVIVFFRRQHPKFLSLRLGGDQKGKDGEKAHEAQKSIPIRQQKVGATGIGGPPRARPAAQASPRCPWGYL